jgi:hypothetical protein
MANLIDPIHFEDLAGQTPGDVCRRALCRYDDAKKSYILSVWGDEFAIYPYAFKIERITENFPAPHEYLYIFIINYLLKAKEIGLSHKWISEKDMPGGATFFRGLHEIPTRLISSRFSGDIKAFRKICDQLGGIPLNMADAAYIFKITPRIPAAVLYWEGDDEFSPESKILFDASITEQLTLDIIFSLAVDICTRIGIAP